MKEPMSKEDFDYLVAERIAIWCADIHYPEDQPAPAWMIQQAIRQVTELWC